MHHFFTSYKLKAVDVAKTGDEEEEEVLDLVT